MLVRGWIYPKYGVSHHCDNPPCVNPIHLFLATQKDNIKDRDRKGRQATLLTEEDVRKIEQIAREGDIPQRQIAKQFGITQSVVSEIKNHLLWKHLWALID